MELGQSNPPPGPEWEDMILQGRLTHTSTQEGIMGRISPPCVDLEGRIWACHSAAFSDWGPIREKNTYMKLKLYGTETCNQQYHSTALGCHCLTVLCWLETRLCRHSEEEFAVCMPTDIDLSNNKKTIVTYSCLPLRANASTGE